MAQQETITAMERLGFHWSKADNKFHSKDGQEMTLLEAQAWLARAKNTIRGK